MLQIKQLGLMALTALLAASCASTLKTTSVCYQSVRSTRNLTADAVPADATIIVGYGISTDGELFTLVRNCTSEVMIIDQTRSFFVDNGRSYMYYDPTVRSTTKTDFSSSTKGASVNLGAVGGFLGMSSPLVGLLSGVNVGGYATTGTSVSNTIYDTDIPQITIAPHSSCWLKSRMISNVGRTHLDSAPTRNFSCNNRQQSLFTFGVVISYSTDNGATYDKLMTDFFVNSEVVVPVRTHGALNEALREIYTAKPDAIYEPWWMIYSVNNLPRDGKTRKNHYIQDAMFRGAFVDFR